MRFNESMNRPRTFISWIGVTAVLLLSLQSLVVAQKNGPQSPVVAAVNSFYRFHLNHNKDFTLRNLRLRGDA